MSKKINSKRDLPKSFDLKKYDELENMSDKDLFRQLYWRSEDLDVTYTDFPDYGLHCGSNYPLHNNIGDPFGEMKESDSFIEKQNEYRRKDKPKILTLSYGDGIRPVDRLLLNFIGEMEAEDGYLKGKSIIIDNDYANDLIERDNGMFWAVMREPVNLLNSAIDGVAVTIDLNNRDDVLIESLSMLLPLWRKELNIEEPPKPVSGGWDSVRKKILEYKIIPMIDLLSWANSTGSKISLGVLAVALFPDGDKDTFMIAQTVKPYLDKLIKINSLEKLRKELSK